MKKLLVTFIIFVWLSFLYLYGVVGLGFHAIDWSSKRKNDGTLTTYVSMRPHLIWLFCKKDKCFGDIIVPVYEYNTGGKQ
jgi:hypothetical protein